MIYYVHACSQQLNNIILKYKPIELHFDDGLYNQLLAYKALREYLPETIFVFNIICHKVLQATITKQYRVVNTSDFIYLKYPMAYLNLYDLEWLLRQSNVKIYNHSYYHDYVAIKTHVIMAKDAAKFDLYELDVTRDTYTFKSALSNTGYKFYNGKAYVYTLSDLQEFIEDDTKKSIEFFSKYVGNEWKYIFPQNETQYIKDYLFLNDIKYIDPSKRKLLKL